MKQKSPAPDADWQLFQDSVGEVRVLDQERSPVIAPRRVTKTRPPAGKGEESSPDKGPIPAKPSRKEYRDIRAGRAPIDAQLDLHGQAFAEAVRHVELFLEEGSNLGHRLLLIITGRGVHSPGGVGVLKGGIVDLLHTRWSNYVIWVADAPVGFGGSGAIVIKLRRIAEPRVVQGQPLTL